MAQATEKVEFPYSVTVETSRGQTVDIPIAFLTKEQVESFLQTDFKRLVQEAGIKGARINLQRAITADYEMVLGDIAAHLRRAAEKAA